MTSATIEMTFRNVDDKDDTITVKSVGYGADNSDKGIGKAVSYAVKYALLKSFSLETGDETDSGHTPPPATPPPDNTKFLEAMRELHAKLADSEKFDAILKDKKVSTIQQVTDKGKQLAIYNAVVAAVESSGQSDNLPF